MAALGCWNCVPSRIGGSKYFAKLGKGENQPNRDEGRDQVGWRWVDDHLANDFQETIGQGGDQKLQGVHS